MSELSEADVVVSDEPAAAPDPIERHLQDLLEGDPAYMRAVQVAVACHHIHLETGHPAAPEIQPFPEELRLAILWSCAEYTQELRLQLTIGGKDTLEHLRTIAANVEAARTAMRYRTNQALSRLFLGCLIDWEGFDRIEGWKPGDYARDREVTA